MCWLQVQKRKPEYAMNEHGFKMGLRPCHSGYANERDNKILRLFIYAETRTALAKTASEPN